MGMKLSAILFVLMLGLGTVSAWYYKNTQERIAVLQDNSAKLESSLQVSEDSIQIMKYNSLQTAKLTANLETSLRKAENNSNKLRKTLRNSNLTKLAIKKPNLIEKRIQDATNSLWNDIATDTQSNRVRIDTTENSNSD